MPTLTLLVSGCAQVLRANNEVNTIKEESFKFISIIYCLEHKYTSIGFVHLHFKS